MPDTEIETHSLEDKDWLVVVEFLSEDNTEERAQGAEAIGYYFGYAQLTNTRILALVGDPVGHAYELLFSFASADGKRRFLELLRSNELTDYDDENPPSVPSFEEIRDAQPIAMVLPEDVVRHAASISATLVMEAEDDEPVN